MPGSQQSGPIISRRGFRVGTKATNVEVANEDGRLCQLGVAIAATAAAIDAGAGIATAAVVPIVDAGGRYDAAEVEAALQEIAGAGRTPGAVETLKAAYDAAVAAYVLPGTGMPNTDMTAAVQASLGLANTSLQPGADVNITTATPVNAVAADEVLEITGVVIDGETVDIGADTYEFAADAAQSVGAGNIAVDIEGDTTKSAGTLTVDTNPVSGDTMTIGIKVYTFVPLGTGNADGEIDVEAGLGDTQANIVAAINGADGHNTAHTLVSAGAFAMDASIITALVGGVAGNTIATTETFFAGTNIFDGAGTLGTTVAGVDCTATLAAVALTAAIVAATGVENVTAAIVAPATDDVTVTYNVAGVIGNAIVLAETMANGNWTAAAVALSGGVNGTVGTQWQIHVDADYIYVCIDTNTIADNNWRRAALGSY